MMDISIKQIQGVGEYWIVYKSAAGKARIQFSLKPGLLGSSARPLKPNSTASAGIPLKNPIEVNPK